MASRSATVLVIFIVAVFAFCLASVFASMTGPISILPNETESGGILDNLSAITNDTIETTSSNNYDYQDYSDDSSDDSKDDSSDDSSSKVETTTDDSSDDDSSSKHTETTVDDSSKSSSKDTSKDSSSSSSGSGGGSSGSNIETTTDDG